MRLRMLLGMCGAALVLAPTAAAHLIVVTPPGQGNGTEHWVSGGPHVFIPGQGEGLFPGPAPGLMLPAAHALGLVHACLATMDKGVVVFIPPPAAFVPALRPDADCRHGLP
jgi:hypothetical protein